MVHAIHAEPCGEIAGNPRREPGKLRVSPPEAEVTAVEKSCAAVKRLARPNVADSANTCPADHTLIGRTVTRDLLQGPM